MRPCTFVSAATVGRQKFLPGDTATLPEAFVRILERRGLVATPASAAPLPLPTEDEESEAVAERVTKPAVRLKRRGLKRLFKG